MWEIQSLTLSLAKSTDQLEARFEERQKAHWQKFTTPSARVQSDLRFNPGEAVGLRVTCLPTLPIDLGDVHRGQLAPFRLGSMWGDIAGHPMELSLPFFRNLRARPLLRGSQCEQQRREGRMDRSL